MTLHSDKHTLQQGVPHEEMVTNQGELVKGFPEDETSAKEMAPSVKQIQNNPFKTPPNNQTNKNDQKMGMAKG